MDYDNLKEMFQFCLHVADNLLSEITIHIIYLDQGGMWSTDGCRDAEREENSITVTCRCNHLSTFGVMVVSVQSFIQY